MPTELSSSTSSVTMIGSPFSLLTRLFGDPAMEAIYSEQSSIELWMRVEVALAAAQARLGTLSHEAAADIAAAAERALPHGASIWESATNVGYPILSVVRLIDSHADADGVGRVHLGATTQDIMDTASAIQLRDATDVLLEHLVTWGDALARLVTTHRATVMAGRTHAQQAVPISLGMKFSVVLDQVRRAHDRLARERSSVAMLSLFGAAGTSAAISGDSARLRELLADELALKATEVPWHVARDALFAQCANAVSAAEVAARFAREIIDLSRTEIGEVLEPGGAHRGASSTMPQKANPILSEAIVGFAVSANSLLAGIGRAMESGHERSAGEWQAEWHLVPQVMVLASSALKRAGELADQLVVNEQAIERNLRADHGLLMAEAYMIALSDSMGRENAHDSVYAACVRTRAENIPLIEVLSGSLTAQQRAVVTEIRPADYIGRAESICDAAVSAWTNYMTPSGREGKK
jgi:3-carboxy-cis,cis-muconate cycloisomerase